MKKILLTLCLALTLVMGLGITSFAAENVKPPDLDPSQYDACIIYYRDSNFMECVVYKSSDWDVTVRINEDRNNDILWTSLSDTPYVRYSKTLDFSTYNSDKPNNGWGTLSQYNSSTGSCSNTLGVHGFIMSSEDIYSTSGSLVFQATPPLEIVTGQALELFQTKTGGVMKILVLCGVGLVASLVGLKVFSKVFRRFRV